MIFNESWVSAELLEAIFPSALFEPNPFGRGEVDPHSIPFPCHRLQRAKYINQTRSSITDQPSNFKIQISAESPQLQYNYGPITVYVIIPKFDHNLF